MIHWVCKKFGELTPDELYKILRLRSEVFVVEQRCIYLDMDNKDYHSYHLLGWEGEKILGYSRIIPSGISYAEFSIGRIVSSPSARGRGIGRELVQQSIKTLYQLYGIQHIRIGAQYHLREFYSSFGFVQKGDIYPEDGIDHIEMLLLVEA